MLNYRCKSSAKSKATVHTCCLLKSSTCVASRSAVLQSLVQCGLTADEATTRHSYDSYGNLTQTTYPQSNVTKYTYGTISGCPESGTEDLYPTQVEEAYGRPEERTTTFEYNCASGRVTRQRDVDNSLTQTFGYDSLARPTTVVEASLREQQTSYQDDQRKVFVERDQFTKGDDKLAASMEYDPLGRLARERSNDTSKISKTGSGGIRVERGYRYSGDNRYELVSTPYVNSSDAGWTRTKYDRNGRVIEVEVFTGKPAPWGSNTTSLGKMTTSYSANTTTVTDPAGVARTNTYDGLGRLTRVRENGISATTCYGYDVLDNLTSVRQGAAASGSSCTGGQLRTFAYDSLSRLKTAVNPESGTTTYSYDRNGNLKTKTDPRSGTAAYAYDKLDRLTGTSYSAGGTDFSSTPAVTYTYSADGASGCKNKHRLTSVSSSISTTSYTCYDGLGRVKKSSQQTGSTTYRFSYVYNLDDTLQSVTYPSTRKLAYQYDAAGRLTAVGENTVGATDYASAIRYKPHGGINSLTLGNGLYESWAYNQRLQPTQIKLGTTSGGSDKLKLDFTYKTPNNNDNNGNVRSQTITRPSLTALTQTYTYDGANRLKSYTYRSATTNYKYGPEGRRVQKATPTVTETYVYDAFGKLAAEYSTAAPTSGGTYYRTTDHLGSTRLVTKQDKSDADCYDFAPFGEEIPNTLGGRSSNACFAASFDGRHRFTGQERDDESDLDYFGARYFGASLGRFISPDPLMASAKVSNPQTWNRYAYTLNNPLRYIDPDGLEVPDDCVQDPECTIVVKINVIYDSTVNEGQGLTTEQKQEFEKEQIEKAQKGFGISNIKLDVTYTPGSYTVDANGLLQLTGLKSDSLNLLVSSGTPTGAAGTSGVNRSGTALTVVNFNEVFNRNLFLLFTNTTSHEFAHQFLGDVFRPKPRGFIGILRNRFHEFVVDSHIVVQGFGVSNQAFRKGLAPRRYAAPLNPQAIKPQQ